MDKFVRLTKTVDTVGDLIPLVDFDSPEKLKTILDKSPNSDWYTSVYYYGPDGKEYFDRNGRTKGYDGSAFTKKLIFDFDNVDLNRAKEASIKLLEKLQKEGVDVVNSCRIYFSGCKGFHVEVYTNREFAPYELKPICKNMIASIDPSYLQKATKVFDSSIYNITRLIRINNTKHQVSGLYKVELEPDELSALTIDQIKEKAKNPVPSTFVPAEITKLEFLDKYKDANYKPASQSVQVILDDEEGIRGLNTVDFDKCPKTTPRCIYALTHGVMQSGIGERNQIFLRLAAWYRNQGFPKEVAYDALKGIAKLNGELYPEHEPFVKEEIYNTVISSVYSDQSLWKIIPGAAGVDPKNELIKRYCSAIDKHTSKKCCLHHKVDNSQAIVQIDNVSDSFKTFAENFERNTVKTGINFIDNNMNIAIGTTTLLVGATGSGKTTATLNLMENANAINQHTMFFSLDMHKNLIYLKLAQKLTNFTQDEILGFYKRKDQAKINFIKQQIADKYGKTFFDFSSTMSLEQMRDKIFAVEDHNGHKIKLVVVDYAGRIAGPHADRYASATYNALKSTEIANVTDAAWIFVSQISRNVGDGCTPLRTKRAAKESGDWEESATNVITMWRPFMGNPDRDDVMRMFLAKNRMGKELESPLFFDGAKGIIRDMTIDEMANYTEVREKEEKEYLQSRLNRLTKS